MTTATMTAPAPPRRATAESMFEQGYRAELRGECLFVIRPDGYRYRVDVRRGTCTCPASVPACKHLRNAVALAILTADALCWQATDLSAAADAERTWGGRRYTARGLELRAESVKVCDRSSRLAQWAYAAAEWAPTPATTTARSVPTCAQRPTPCGPPPFAKPDRG